MYLKHIVVVFISGVLSVSVLAGTGNALIGWQTFENATPGNNNSGIADTTPDTNSTYDAIPVGNISASGHYLTGAIGPEASNTGRDGLGLAINSDFLNGNNFGGGTAGNGELIESWPLADGSPGVRIGPFTTPNNNMGSSWKFGESDNQRRGDFKITNNSSYFFRLEFFHYDARRGAADSPNNLQLIYLATPGNLIRKVSGTELADLQSLNNTSFATAGVQNISRGIGAAISSAAYLAPGESAAFRFIWTGQVTAAAQSQIDNLAIEGTFFETADLINVVDPVAVDAVNVPVLPMVFQWLLAGIFAAISVVFLARKR